MQAAEPELEDNSTFLDSLISPEMRRRTREHTQPFLDMCCSTRCIRNTFITGGSAIILLSVLLIAISVSNSSDKSMGVISRMQSDPSWMLSRVTKDMIAIHMQNLASDEMEGRGTGTRGEALATQYVESHFEMAGLQPIDTSFYHPVPLFGLTALPLSEPLILAGQTVQSPESFTFSSDLEQEYVEIADAPMVFVGFGITSKDYDWDDYKNVNVSGKICVCFVNEPTAINDTDLFLGDVLTYYGRWTYKFSQARSKGALGVLLIHTNSTAGYAWNVVQNSFGLGEQVYLRDPAIQNPLRFKGWIDQTTAENLAKYHGYTLDQWFSLASQASFTPIPLSTTLSLNMPFGLRVFEGTNVVGYLGPAPSKDTPSVVILAHHDHLGIRPNPEGNGTSIFNGAVDNASGVAALIASAYALGSLYDKDPFVDAPDLAPLPLKKTIIFLSSTGEESNLLGALYFTNKAPCSVAVCNAVTAINYDVMNVWGKTLDTVAIGWNSSSVLDQIVTRAAGAEKMNLTPDPTPNLGHLFRSDQLAFALSKVPSISFSSGTDYQGQTPYWAAEVTKRYQTQMYHQPTDDYDPKTMDMGGAVQQVRLSLRVAYEVATTDAIPTMDSKGLLPDEGITM